MIWTWLDQPSLPFRTSPGTAVQSFFLSSPLSLSTLRRSILGYVSTTASRQDTHSYWWGALPTHLLAWSWTGSQETCEKHIPGPCSQRFGFRSSGGPGSQHLFQKTRRTLGQSAQLTAWPTSPGCLGLLILKSGKIWGNLAELRPPAPALGQWAALCAISSQLLEVVASSPGKAMLSGIEPQIQQERKPLRLSIGAKINVHAHAHWEPAPPFKARA